jgi:hypothetical protein
MKIKAWFNVITHILLVDGLLRALSFVVFPIAYLLRAWVRKVHFYPLWIFLEDPYDLGNPQEAQDNIGIQPTTWFKRFLVAYYECVLRNPTDNLQVELALTGERTNHHFIKGNSDVMLRAKFYNEDEEKVANAGKFLSQKYSLFGKNFVYFRQNGKWLVLYSTCYISKQEGERVTIREFNIGAASRILIRNKWTKAIIKNQQK